MPTYLYVCEKCDAESEENFSINNYPQEISCFQADCDGKKKLTPSIGQTGRINFKIAGDNSGSQAKRMRK